MRKQVYFVTGIGTEVGKTVVSAILTKALNAEYWKPVQAGDLDNSDSLKVQRWTGQKTHPEAFRLTSPMSPHAAARIDQVSISLEDFTIPTTRGPLIIEGAGGLYVPLNEQDCMIDLIQKLNIPVVLVSRNYLGSINHTLLSIEALKSRKIEIAGLIFSGEENKETQRIIEQIGDVKVLGRILELSQINAETIGAEASRFKAQVQKLI